MTPRQALSTYTARKFSSHFNDGQSTYNYILGSILMSLAYIFHQQSLLPLDTTPYVPLGTVLTNNDLTVDSTSYSWWCSSIDWDIHLLLLRRSGLRPAAWTSNWSILVVSRVKAFSRRSTNQARPYTELYIWKAAVFYTTRAITLPYTSDYYSFGLRTLH